MKLNWKLLTLPILGLSLLACDSKKEEKKADEATPPEAAKVEAPKPAETMPAEAPKPAETMPAEAPKEEPKAEHKAS